MSRKVMIKFETELDLKRDQWVQMFSSSDLARLVKATNVSVHFGQKGYRVPVNE